MTMTHTRTLLIALLIPFLMAGCDVFGSNDDDGEAFESVEIRSITVLEIPNFSESGITLGTNIYDEDEGEIVWYANVRFNIERAFALRIPYVVRRSFDDLSTTINIGLTKDGRSWQSSPSFTLAEMLSNADISSQQQEYEIEEGRIKIVISYVADPA